MRKNKLLIAMLAILGGLLLIVAFLMLRLRGLEKKYYPPNTPQKTIVS